MAQDRDTQPHWYVAHTYSGYENKVRQDLETIVENRRLQDLCLLYTSRPAAVAVYIFFGAVRTVPPVCQLDEMKPSSSRRYKIGYSVPSFV